MLPTHALDYQLPDELIATEAAVPRDAARLLVARRSGQLLHHAIVRDLPSYLNPGDLLILNNTMVVPAWLEGHRVGTGGKVNGLYLRTRPHETEERWVILLRGKHLHEGVRLRFEPFAERAAFAAPRNGEAPHPFPEPGPDCVQVELLGKVSDEPGAWVVRVVERPDASGLALLDRVGSTPVPPYIRHVRKAHQQPVEVEADRRQYQTVYADASTLRTGLGSVAAPTAGLHFTPELLAALDSRGVRRASVALHVGSGTFKPIDAEFVEEHQIHAEWCSVGQDVIEQIREARARGGRVVAVGTTVARALETYAMREEAGEPWRAWVETKLLIAPGHRWRWVDGLMTNFHLPRSSLLALVAAFLEPGLPALLDLYREAIAQRYRFYSYGDAMLIVP